LPGAENKTFEEIEETATILFKKARL